MKTLHTILLIIFVVLISNSWNLIAAEKSLTLVSEFEGGKLYRAGNINLPVLTGSFREMGRQFGGLLKKELNEFYDFAIQKKIIKEDDYLTMKNKIAEDIQKHPRFIQELIKGMSETSGMNLEKQYITCNIIIISVTGGCSGIFAWGDYTSNGSLICGRNWDLGFPKELMSKYVTVTVFNPTGYANSVADINYLGQFPLWQTGLNSSGIFMDLQNGSMSDPVGCYDRLRPNDFLFSMLFDYSTMERINAAFNSYRSAGGVIINACDSKNAYSYELATYDTKKRSPDKDGLLSSTNNFTDSSWPGFAAVPDGEKGAFTKERRANLLALGEKYKGKINAEMMMKILDVTIPDGGATFPDATNYQIVAVPQGLKLYLKVNGFQDWTEIDLKGLFKE